MSYQEKIVGHQMYFVFAMALLLVYLVLAGQYESWYAPLSVVLSVPLALVGPVLAISALRIDNNLYTQIGIILLIALSAKNAILIVDMARDRRLHDNKSLIDAAVEAAQARFRPIVMTSFAFILSVVPLVLATGAGASARQSIGVAVFSGMIASTCLAVLFAPSIFVVVQRFEEWRSPPQALTHEPAHDLEFDIAVATNMSFALAQPIVLSASRRHVWPGGGRPRRHRAPPFRCCEN